MTQMLTESVVLSVFGGVVGTIFGALIAHHDLAVDADSGVDSAVVGRARHRHHRAGGAVLRAVSGVASRAAWIRSRRCAGANENSARSATG